MRLFTAAGATTALFLGLALSQLHAGDRFIVPVPESSSPAPSSSSPSSSGSSGDSGGSGSYSNSSGGSGSSGGSSSSGDYGNSNSGSDRFIVPVPHRSPRGGGGGGPIYGGGGFGGPGYYYDDYWGGCYYWSGRYYYWGGYYYSPFAGRFSRAFDEPDYEQRAYRRREAPSSNRLPIFFPPDPPPLGAAVPPPPPQLPYLSAPVELATHVADLFYPALSTRLAKRNLTTALRKRVDAYVAAKSDLQAALHERLKALATAPADARLRELEAFARTQTPAIAALETEAERLRTDLLRPGLVGTFWGTGDWNEHRQWRLGRPASLPRDQTLGSEFQVIRAAAYYQDGFSPVQRRLLREVAMELQVEAFRPKDAAPDSSTEAFDFFSPETARIRLPAMPSPELETKISAYLKDKTALKSELREIVYQQDTASPAERVRAIRQLASAQAPRLQALETLAEEIRRGLASAQSVLGELSSASPELANRLVALHRAWRGLEDDLAGRLAAINQSYGFEAVTYRIGTNFASHHVTLSARVNPSSRAVAVQRRLDDTVATFNRESAPRGAELKTEAQAIRTAITDLATTRPALLGGKGIDAWWEEAMQSLQQQNVPALYRDYQAAALEPGLSPEQRRLLFDAALQELRIPLPGGELAP